MQTSRILWLIWCGVWAVLWSVLGFLSLAAYAVGDTKPTDGVALLALLSVLAMFLPVGKPKLYDRFNERTRKWEKMS